jgi:hypothetical protein
MVLKSKVMSSNLDSVIYLQFQLNILRVRIENKLLNSFHPIRLIIFWDKLWFNTVHKADIFYYGGWNCGWFGLWKNDVLCGFCFCFFVFLFFWNQRMVMKYNRPIERPHNPSYWSITIESHWCRWFVMWKESLDLDRD